MRRAQLPLHNFLFRSFRRPANVPQLRLREQRKSWLTVRNIATLMFVVCSVGLTYETAFSQNRAADARNANGRQIPNGGADNKLNARQLAEGIGAKDALSPEGMPSTLKIMFLLTVLSLAPSILIMTTCFIRFVIVFGLLRQALGTQQLPPNQVIVSLCLFLTFMVMTPVWEEAYARGIKPYTDNKPIPGLKNPDEKDPDKKFEQAMTNTLKPLRKFMSDQIEMTGNSDAVWMFLEFQNKAEEGEWQKKYQNYDDVPTSALLPAFMLSELKTAFVIGFQVYLPFLVIDLVVASVLISMGMMMLPPVLISLPFKILLFVLIDGWFLTVGMLLESIKPYT